MKKITYAIEINFDLKGNPTLLINGGKAPVDGEIYVQIEPGYWVDLNGSNMHSALCELAEHWISRQVKS